MHVCMYDVCTHKKIRVLKDKIGKKKSAEGTLL